MKTVETTKEAKEAERKGEPTVKIIYCCRQQLPKEIGSFCSRWKEGEIKRVSMREARILLKNHGFFFEKKIIKPAEIQQVLYLEDDKISF